MLAEFPDEIAPTEAGPGTRPVRPTVPGNSATQNLEDRFMASRRDHHDFEVWHVWRPRCSTTLGNLPMCGCPPTRTGPHGSAMGHDSHALCDEVIDKDDA